MWSAPRPARHRGRRRSCADAPPDVRALYRRTRPRQLSAAQPGQRPLRGQDARRRAPRWAAGPGPPTRSTSTATARTILYVVNGMLTRRGGPGRPGRLLLAAGRRAARRSRVSRARRYDDAWRAINQLLIHGIDRQPPAQRVPAQRRPGRLRRGLGNARPRPRSGRPLVRGPRRRRRRRSGSGGDGRASGAAAAHLPQRLRGRGRASIAVRLRRHEEQPRRDRRAGDRRDRSAAQDEDRAERAPASSRSIRRSC